MGYLLKRFRLGALVAVVFGLAAGGLAYASIPDSSGVIHGCYSPNGAQSTGGSALHIIDSDSASCSKGQEQISWNQAGPKGATGPTGQRGPSDAWDASSSDVDIPSSGAAATVVSVSLPEGNFFVAAKAAIVGPGGVNCVLEGPAGAFDSSLSGASALTVVPVQGTLSLASAGAVSLQCTATTGFELGAAGHIDAIEVGALH